MAEFVMPILGADMEAGTLVAWRKQPGDRLERGDIIAEVETEKGVIDVEVFTSGVLERLLVQPGAKVPVGTVLAIIREDRRRDSGAAARGPVRAGAAAACRHAAHRFPTGRCAACGSATPPHLARGAQPARPSSASISPRVAGTGPDGAITRRTSSERRPPGASAGADHAPACARRSPPRWRAPSARSRTTTCVPRSTCSRPWRGWRRRTRSGRSPSGCWPGSSS